MTERRRTSETQMADLNVQLNDQNDQLKRIRKVAEKNNDMTQETQKELHRQREVIERAIDKNKQIAYEVKKADLTTNQMRRRQWCIKGGLWILAILLFLTNIALIIYKVETLYS